MRTGRNPYIWLGTDKVFDSFVFDFEETPAGWIWFHAYPSVDNGPSNAICRKLGFELLGAEEFEYPKGHWMRCNDWSLEL